MRSTHLVTILCLFLLAGCYVSTSLEADKKYLPANFSAPVLVITVEDKVGLYEAHIVKLEQDALEAFTDRGIECITLSEAIGEANSDMADELLKEKDYKALLTIVILSWGSRSQILRDPVPTHVGRTDTGPESGSLFRPPGDIDAGKTVPGPEASFKQVEMTGAVMDLQNNRLVWSGRVDARPAVVGRSIVYKRFNRNIKLDELANRCFNKLARALARVWPENSES